MRTFIAIELEEEVKDALEGAQQQAAELCRKGNYTPKENFHLTLHFLGEIRPEEVDDVVKEHVAFVPVSHVGEILQRALARRAEPVKPELGKAQAPVIPEPRPESKPLSVQ